MNKTKRLLLAGTTAAALALGTALNAQVTPQVGETQITPQTGERQLQGTLHTDQTRQEMTAGQQKPVTEANKASNLVGMNVRNLQDERLGQINDMVIDLEAGKVSYVVLSVGGFLGIGDRHIAVPLHAFSVSPDRDHLILNADRQRIQNAPGLARNAWPDINSPLLAADQWPGAGAAYGTPGETRTGTGFETHPDTQPGVGTTQPGTTQPIPPEQQR